MGESLDVLSRLVLEARQDLQRRRHLVGSEKFETAVAAYTPKDFAGALRKPQLSVIAEMKQRTPKLAMCVKTEIAAAPPSAYECARSAGR